MDNKFLEPRWQADRSLLVTLTKHLPRQASYIAALDGWEHVGIGSDLDGGSGQDESPAEIESIADLVKIGAVVPPEAREGELGGNWIRFFMKSLP